MLAMGCLVGPSLEVTGPDAPGHGSFAHRTARDAPRHRLRLASHRARRLSAVLQPSAAATTLLAPDSLAMSEMATSAAIGDTVLPVTRALRTARPSHALATSPCPGRHPAPHAPSLATRRW